MEQVLKQEAEDTGNEGKEILDYVKEQQKLDRERERAEWRKSGWQNCKQKKKKLKIKRGLRSALLRFRLRKTKPR